MVLAFGLANLVIDIASGVLFCAYPDAYKAVLVFAEPESLEADGGMNIRSALTHVVADTYRTVAVLVTASAAMADDAISSTAADAWGAIAVEIPVLVMAASGSGARRGTGTSRGGPVLPVLRRRGRRSRRLLHPRGTATS